MNTADQLRVSIAVQAIAGPLKFTDPVKFQKVQEDIRDYYERELQFAQAQLARDEDEANR